MRSSLRVVITINFNRPRTHLHSFRELILLFQTLDRQPSSQNNNHHWHSFIPSCSEKGFSFEWKQNEFRRHSPKPHPSSNAPFQHDTLSSTIKNTYYTEFNLQLHFSLFVSERAYDPYWEYVTETGIAYTELILTFRRPNRASKAHPIQHSNDTHDLNWALWYFSFEEPALSSPFWTMFLAFLFMNILILFSYVNQAEYWHAHSALFRDLFLKRSKYYAKHYHRESFGPRQDMQILVGTPLPTRPYVIRVIFT